VSARPFALLTAGLVLAATAGPLAGSAMAATTAPTPQAAPSSTVGLFGSADPTYDGVYRQSLSILALTATGHQPNAAAVAWLAAQQCANGGFEAFRTFTSAPCAAGAEDENATALAIDAFVALGKPVAPAVTALKAFQLADGGFYESTAFGPPAADADSTGLAQSALVAAGIVSTTVASSSGKTASDFLRSVQLPCTATTGAGSFDYQPAATLHANDLATVQATLGQLATTFPVAAGTTAATVPACPATISDAATSSAAALSYLAARLVATKGAIPSSLGSGTDWTSTADAVIDLVAGGTGSAAIAAAVTALEANVTAYAGKAGSYAPGPLATLILAAHAAAIDPTSFGGVDLVTALASTERLTSPVTPSPSPSASVAPSVSPSAASSPSASPSGGASLPMTGATHTSLLAWVALSLIAGGAVALGGAGFAGRRRS
jgi:hypothetical protein